MMSISIMERNVGIVQHHLYDHMRDTMNVLNKVIQREVNKISFLLRPAVSLFFSTMGKPMLERMGKQTLKDAVELGKQLVTEGAVQHSAEFYQKLEAILPRILENDQTIQYCSKRHKNFHKLEDAVKKLFESQVLPIMQMLMVEDANVTDYASLCKSACTKDQIEGLIASQINAMEESIHIIEEDLSILNVPIAREFAVRVIKEGVRIKRTSFFTEIDQIYH